MGFHLAVTYRDFKCRKHIANALRYNDESSFVHGVAKDLGVEFENMFAKTVAEIAEEEARRRAGDNAGALCGGEKCTFEPLVIYCNGTCGNRIRRNANYFSCPQNNYHWCTSCHSDIKTEEIIMGEVQLRKSELIKKKNSEWGIKDTKDRDAFATESGLKLVERVGNSFLWAVHPRCHHRLALVQL